MLPDELRFGRDQPIGAERMGIMDRNTPDYGIPLLLLMECAGYAAADRIRSFFELKEGDKAIIFCGAGNNGGDGMVVARHLAAVNIDVKVFFIGNPLKIGSEHARLNFKIIKNLRFSIDLKIIGDSSEIPSVTSEISAKDRNRIVIVDALLGTGVKGKLREPIRSAIEAINKLHDAGFKVASIDVPSGMNPDTGSAFDIYVKCDLLVTMHRPKIGLTPEKLGCSVVTVPIGIPPESEVFVGSGDVTVLMKKCKRKEYNHKGQHGRLLVIGGSSEYSGAPSLASLAAIEADTDLVTLYTPASVANVIRSFSPNLIVRTGRGENLSPEDIGNLIPLIERSDAIVLGPGLGRAPETIEFVPAILEILGRSKIPTVIDADAIKICADHHELLVKLNPILTPHFGEFTALTGIKLPTPIPDNFGEISRNIIKKAADLNSVLLVKGRYDFISDGREIRINATGVPQMAVGGTGDILAGLTGSFLAKGASKFESACVSAYISGKLGEFYLAKYSVEGHRRVSFKSSDLLKIIPEVLGKYSI